MLTPRYYQKEAVEATWDFLFSGKGNPVIACPTGTGKSLIIAEFVKKACLKYPKTRVMMLTHVKELIAQNYSKLLDQWPTAPAGIYSAGLSQKEAGFPVTFGGRGSVINNLEGFGRKDIIIIDECHLVSTKQNSQYIKIIEHFKKKNKNIKVIGLSATPYRMGQGLLTDGGIFDGFSYDNTNLEDFNRLIDEGFLCPLYPKKTALQLDLSNVRSQSDDYVLKSLQEEINKDELTKNAVRESIVSFKETMRRKILVFASGIEHAESITRIFKEYGLPAVCVHSKIKEKERDKRIQLFKDNAVPVIVNNGILTTGHDIPDLDMIVMLRPTKSTALWVQMLGRGTRVYPDKDYCLVLDFSGNTERLGAINDPVIPAKKGKKKGNGGAPVKVCPKCNHYNHASVRECVNCGFVFPKQNKITVKASNAELIKRRQDSVKELKVKSIIYSRHTKATTCDSLKVTYVCGLRMFSEYVCLEHDGYARHKAKIWWEERCNFPVPDSIDEALELTQDLKEPKSIVVDTFPKYPEITGYVF